MFSCDIVLTILQKKNNKKITKIERGRDDVDIINSRWDCSSVSYYSRKIASDTHLEIGGSRKSRGVVYAEIEALIKRAHQRKTCRREQGHLFTRLSLVGPFMALVVPLSSPRYRSLFERVKQVGQYAR